MASSMNSFDDIKDLQKQLMHSFIDTALKAEMEYHLGYPKHEKAGKPNKRNGHNKKTVRSDTGDLEISIPRDRDSSFEPVLVIKHQSHILGLDYKNIFHYRHSLMSCASASVPRTLSSPSSYTKGQTTTEIVETITEL